MPVPPPYPHERRKGTILKEAKHVTMANPSFTLRGTDLFSSSWFTCRSVLINVPARHTLEMIPKSMILVFFWVFFSHHFLVQSKQKTSHTFACCCSRHTKTLKNCLSTRRFFHLIQKQSPGTVNWYPTTTALQNSYDGLRLNLIRLKILFFSRKNPFLPNGTTQQVIKDSRKAGVRLKFTT